MLNSNDILISVTALTSNISIGDISLDDLIPA